MMEGRVISEEEEAMDGLRGFQEVSSQEPALRRLRDGLSEQEDRRGRAQSFSLNRNLCSERERANSFTHNKSHNYLERVKMRRSQQAVHLHHNGDLRDSHEYINRNKFGINQGRVI